MKTQYNFKIEDELKQELEALQAESAINGKEEFLTELMNGYKQCKASSIDTEIDLSKYEAVSTQTKTVIYDAFKHILATIESNSTNNKQQALSLERDSLSIVEERKSFEEQIQQLTATHNQKLLNIEEQHKEQLQIKDEEIEKAKSDNEEIEKNKNTLLTQLTDIQKELQQVQSIAEQVQSITESNKELRTELKQLTATHNQKLLDIDNQHKEQLQTKDKEIENFQEKIKEQEKLNFENKLISENKDKELILLKEQLSVLTEKDTIIKELEKQNIVLSTKLEIIEK
jgi:hypothetical protein